jgi:ubiquinone/menaquinone biosynthesis C-methylase UbiE
VTTATETIDAGKAEAFAGQIIGFYNGAAMAMMTSVGHRAGLFDVMSGLKPSTSAEIAKAAKLDERYVREWLGAMTVSGVVEHDAAKMTYALPPEHAASLTRAAGTGNLAAMSEFFAVMGVVEDQIIDCFRKGGGVPYSAFPKFQELMRQESAAVFDQTLVDATLPMAPGLVDRLKKGIDVADVGCGAGHAINVMARAFPNSRFVGFDFSEEGISRGRTEAADWGLKNARFEVKDAAELDGSQQFDLITVFDAIHDQAKPAKVLQGISAALKPGGTFLCVDIQADSTHAGNMEHPLAPFLYMISTFHCMTVSLAYGGDGLGTVWGEQLATKMLNDAGFKNIETRRVEGDIINNYYIATK